MATPSIKILAGTNVEALPPLDSNDTYDWTKVQQGFRKSAQIIGPYAKQQTLQLAKTLKYMDEDGYTQTGTFKLEASPKWFTFISAELNSTGLITVNLGTIASKTTASAAPATPGVSGTPAISATPAISGTPGVSTTPAVPGKPSAPATSGVPATSAIPATSGVPATSAIPATSGVPATSAVPATSTTSTGSIRVVRVGFVFALGAGGGVGQTLEYYFQV